MRSYFRFTFRSSRAHALAPQLTTRKSYSGERRYYHPQNAPELTKWQRDEHSPSYLACVYNGDEDTRRGRSTSRFSLLECMKVGADILRKIYTDIYGGGAGCACDDPTTAFDIIHVQSTEFDWRDHIDNIGSFADGAARLICARRSAIRSTTFAGKEVESVRCAPLELRMVGSCRSCILRLQNPKH